MTISVSADHKFSYILPFFIFLFILCVFVCVCLCVCVCVCVCECECVRICDFQSTQNKLTIIRIFKAILVIIRGIKILTDTFYKHFFFFNIFCKGTLKKCPNLWKMKWVAWLCVERVVFFRFLTLKNLSMKRKNEMNYLEKLRYKYYLKLYGEAKCTELQPFVEN